MSNYMLAFVVCSSLSAFAFAGRPPALQSRALSEEPSIWYWPGFVEPEDVLTLRELASEVGLDPVDEVSGEVSGGEESCVLNVTEAAFFEDEGVEESPGWMAAQRFQARALEWAGSVPGHTVPVVTRWEPWAMGSRLNRSGLLHLDARRRPQHRHTVLAFLSGGASGQRGPADNHAADGLTVFPCVETEDMEAEEAARRRRMCSRAHRHVRLAHEKLLQIHAEGLALPPSKQLAFLEAHPELTSLPQVNANGDRPVEWRWTPEYDAVADQPGASKADSLSALAESMCRGEAPGLAIAPEAGSAILFEAATPNRKGVLGSDWQLWHAGCSPAEGRGFRWTVQLFIDDDALSQKEAQCLKQGKTTKQCRVHRSHS